MKRNLITILSLVMSVMCNATSAFPQANAKANVPFAFNVGGFQLRAGTYEIKVLKPKPVQDHDREQRDQGGRRVDYPARGSAQWRKQAGVQPCR